MCVGQILHDCVRGRDRLLRVHDRLLRVHGLRGLLRVRDRDHVLHLHGHDHGRDPRGLLLSDQVPR